MLVGSTKAGDGREAAACTRGALAPAAVPARCARLPSTLRMAAAALRRAAAAVVTTAAEERKGGKYSCDSSLSMLTLNSNQTVKDSTLYLREDVEQYDVKNVASMK